jgi:hypothetical protein
MAAYAVNESAVARARELIKARQYVVRSEWGEVQPRAADENAFLEEHSWEEYAAWHLGLTEGVSDGTKARYAFVFTETSDGSTARGSSPVTTSPRNGSTRRSSWPRMTSCSSSTPPEPEHGGGSLSVSSMNERASADTP